MPQDLLHLIQGPPAVNEEGCILVPQVMKTQLWQACFLSDPKPNLGDGGVALTRPGIDEDPTT